MSNYATFLIFLNVCFLTKHITSFYRNKHINIPNNFIFKDITKLINSESKKKLSISLYNYKTLITK